jgi:hypothetical protein
LLVPSSPTLSKADTGADTTAHSFPGAGGLTAASLPALCSIAARCSQMLTRFCGRNHESPVDAVDASAVPPPLVRKDDMSGSWVVSRPPGWMDRALQRFPPQPAGAQRRGRRGFLGFGSLGIFFREAFRLPVGYPVTSASCISSRCRARDCVAMLLAIVLPRRDLDAIVVQEYRATLSNLEAREVSVNTPVPGRRQLPRTQRHDPNAPDCVQAMSNTTAFQSQLRQFVAQRIPSACVVLATTRIAASSTQAVSPMTDVVHESVCCPAAQGQWARCMYQCAACTCAEPAGWSQWRPSTAAV